MKSVVCNFPTYEHHICLVSAQSVPNILPIFLASSCPRHVHLIITPPMQDTANTIAGIVRKRGCTVHTYSLKTMHPIEMYAALDTVLTCYTTQHGKSIALNATGGTKIMALAAAEWATVYEIPLFYVDTQNDTLLILGKEGHSFQLPDVLDVETILAAQGYTLEKQQNTPLNADRRAILVEMLPKALKGGLRVLNACANKCADGTNLSASFIAPLKEDTREILKTCRKGGMLDFTETELVFASQEAARWCGGIWLEEYVQSVLFHLHAGGYVHAWSCAASIRSQKIDNEIDALFTARNRLFVIECKTANMGGYNSKSSGYIQTKQQYHENQSENAIYKIDALLEKIGGVFAQGMLLTLERLTYHQNGRVKKYNLHVVSGEELLKLDTHIKRWIKQ